MKRIFFILALLFILIQNNSSAETLEDMKNSERFLVNTGNEYYAKGKYEQSIEPYSKALRLYEKIAILEEQPNEKEYLKENRKNHLAMLYGFLGDAYKNTQKLSKAVENYNKAIEYDPKYYNYRFYRAEAYFLQGKYELAVEDYDQAIKLRKDDKMFNFFFQRGLAKERLKQYDSAIQDYMKTIEVYPRHFEAKYRIVQCYEKQGKNDKALDFYNSVIEPYTKAIELNPQDAKAYTNRGFAYDRMYQWSEAIADYTKAIEINPQDAGTYLARGATFEKLNQKKQAIENYQLFIKYADPRAMEKEIETVKKRILVLSGGK